MTFDQWLADHGITPFQRTAMAQRAWDAATLAERERCAVLATELAEDAAMRYAGGHAVHFGRDVGDAIRAGVKP